MQAGTCSIQNRPGGGLTAARYPYKLSSTPSRKPSLIARARASQALAPPELLEQAGAAPAAVAPAEEQAGTAQALAALNRMLHPIYVQPSNLVSALQTALRSLHQRPSSRGWERALLASPLLHGLLAWAVQLLDDPQVLAMLGPEAPLLVLECLSHLGSSPIPGTAVDGSASKHSAYSRLLWRRAHAALGDAADAAGRFTLLQPSLMSPEMLVRYYEACARSSLAGAPTRSCGLGLLLRSHLRNGLFSADECVRLLVAWAQLRRRRAFNPESYNFAELAACLSARAGQLSTAQLQAVAAAAVAFEWPTYRSVPLLHAVCRETVQRFLAGSLSLPAAQHILHAGMMGAAGMRPRIGQELEAAIFAWMASPGAASSAAASAAAPQQQQQPQWLFSTAAHAMAAECSSNIVVLTGSAAVLAALLATGSASLAADVASSMDA